MPPATGTYRFSLNASGTARLFIQDKPVVEIPKQSGVVTVSGMTTLTAGQSVPIRVECTGTAAIHVGWQTPEQDLLSAAVKAAKESDVAIVFAGERAGEGYDRTGLKTPGDLDYLIEAVAAANPRTIVVLNTAGPVAMPWLDKVSGVVEAWYPGPVRWRGDLGRTLRRRESVGSFADDVPRQRAAGSGDASPTSIRATERTPTIPKAFWSAIGGTTRRIRRRCFRLASVFRIPAFDTAARVWSIRRDTMPQSAFA